MRFDVTVPALALVLTIAVAAAPAAAQTRSFATLPARLAIGTHVIVTTADGASTPGRVTAVTADGLNMREDGGGPERHVTAGNTTRIVHDDSPINGALLGALAGPAVTLGWLHAAGGSDSFGAVMLNGSLLFGAGGAVIGMMIDDLHHETVYEAPRARRTSVGPIVGRGRAGVGVAISF